EVVEVSDVVRLHDEVVRVRREGEPVPDDRHVLRLAVEEGARAALSVRAVFRRVCLLDVKEHASLLVRGRLMRGSRTLHTDQGLEWRIFGHQFEASRPRVNAQRHPSASASIWAFGTLSSSVFVSHARVAPMRHATSRILPPAVYTS